MSKRAARLFFLISTLVSALIFTILTIDSHRQFPRLTNSAAIDARVIAGKHVWHRQNCTNCHTLLGEGAYYAPDLTEIVAQRGKGYLSAFLADPSAFYSEERDGRLMPTLGLSPQEIDDVLEFLAWVDGIDTNGWPPRPILVTGEAPRAPPGAEPHVDAPLPGDRGRALFHGAGACAGCHAVAPGVHLVGPSLAGIAGTAATRVADPSYHGDAKAADDYLRESILDPSRFVAPGGNFATPEGRSFMPEHYAKTLDAGQVDDLIAYLVTLR